MFLHLGGGGLGTRSHQCCRGRCAVAMHATETSTQEAAVVRDSATHRVKDAEDQSL
jgi:hypothetical protein